MLQCSLLRTTRFLSRLNYRPLHGGEHSQSYERGFHVLNPPDFAMSDVFVDSAHGKAGDKADYSGPENLYLGCKTVQISTIVPRTQIKHRTGYMAKSV
jgi:hypothetical protein